MTTSGSTVYSMTRDNIIRAAMRKLGILGQGQQPTAQDISDASQALNLMIKGWVAKGMNLWTMREGVLFLAAAQQHFKLGLTSTDYVCDADDLVETSVSVAALTGALTITVASATGITSGYQIGIAVSPTSIIWTTVNGAPVGNVVTLAAALTADASAGCPVYVFPTTKIPRPLDIPDARRRQYSSNTDIPILTNNREQYFALPTKNAVGAINQYYYDPQLNNGVVYLWPTTNDVRDQFRFTYHRPIFNFDTIANTQDFPDEWCVALVFNLAVELAPEYGIDPSDKLLLEATDTKNALMGFDTDVSIFIQPSISFRRA